MFPNEGFAILMDTIEKMMITYKSYRYLSEKNRWLGSGTG
jgi:hypothetical protein